MIKKTEWVCGNVNVEATLTLPDNTPAGIAILATDGLTQILQRKPSSAWEKAEAGYEKRPDGFKRADEIPYSAESADRLEKGFIAALPEGVKVEFVMTQKVDGDSVKPSKEAQDIWKGITQLQGKAKADALAVLELADVDDDDAGIAAVHARLRQAKRDAATAAKATLGL